MGAGTPAPAAAGEARPSPPTPPPQRPDAHARIDGLRAWLGDLDRRLGLRTYVLGAAALLALAAAVVALVLVLQLKRDAATESDVNSLKGQLSGVQRSAANAAQRSVQSLNRRLTALEGRVNRLSSGQATSRRELKVAQDDIKELRREIAAASSKPAGGGAATASGTTTTTTGK
jgi:uncharacterized protein HemX